jgi:hypothetical protein
LLLFLAFLLHGVHRRGWLRPFTTALHLICMSGFIRQHVMSLLAVALGLMPTGLTFLYILSDAGRFGWLWDVTFSRAIYILMSILPPLSELDV